MKKFNSPQGALSSRPKGRGFVEAIWRSLPRSSGLTGKRKMKLAIIEAIGLAAMFIIAAAVSYNSGYVGGRVDEAANIGLAANGQNGREVAK